MKSQLKMLDDLAQLAGGAVGLASHIQSQVKQDIRERIDEKLNDMNFVAREDFDRLEALLSKSLKRQEELDQKLEQLEKSKSQNKPSKAKK